MLLERPGAERVVEAPAAPPGRDQIHAPGSYAPTRAEAERKGKEFEAWCHQHGYGKAIETLGGFGADGSLLSIPPGARRATNVVESPFAALRSRTDAAKRFKQGWEGPRR